MGGGLGAVMVGLLAIKAGRFGTSLFILLIVFEMIMLLNLGSLIHLTFCCGDYLVGTFVFLVALVVEASLGVSLLVGFARSQSLYLSSLV